MRDNSLDCTKCGHILKSYSRDNKHGNFDSTRACENKECVDYDVTPFETREKKDYQARLDKVLSKMVSVSNCSHKYLDLGCGMELQYSDSKGLRLFVQHHGYRKNTPLDTVEILIRDLEANNV